MDEQTFWRSLDRSGDCWVWTGKRLPKGYARFWLNGVQVYAHRVAYELTRGPIPEGWVVCHRCDNPPCARPSHLFAGTQLENTRDKIAKGRGIVPVVCRCMTEALTPAEQRVVDAMLTAGSEAEAGERLGLSRHTVHNYLRSARSKRNVRTTRALVALEASRHEQA